MKSLLYLFITFFISNSLYALELQGTFFQGNLIVGKTDSQSIVFIDKKRIKLSKKGFFVFGLSKDRKNDVIIETIKNQESKQIIKKVYKKKYK